MRTWHFFDRSSGLFTGKSFTGPEAALELNLPEGHGAIEGVARWRAQRVNLGTGMLEDYVPPKPGADAQVDYEWSEEAFAWMAFKTPAGIAAEARAKRDALLAACDWIVSRSVERDESVPADWQAYRQALRDITKQPEFPHQVTWPDPPS